MGKNTVDVTDASFDSDVLKSGKTVIVDFWAEWCTPCKMVAPVLDEIAGENQEKITIAKLDIDVNQKTAQAYKVMSIPTMIVFQGGKPVKQIVGARPKAALLSDLAAYLGLIAQSRCPAPLYQGRGTVISRLGHAHAPPASRCLEGGRAQWPTRSRQPRRSGAMAGEMSEECMQLLRRGDCGAAVVEIRAMLRQFGLAVGQRRSRFRRRSSSTPSAPSSSSAG